MMPRELVELTGNGDRGSPRRSLPVPSTGPEGQIRPDGSLGGKVMKRMLFLVTIVALLTVGTATPVLAAPPDNDSYAGRAIIGSVPFAQSVDTTEATTDADDTE